MKKQRLHLLITQLHRKCLEVLLKQLHSNGFIEVRESHLQVFDVITQNSRVTAMAKNAGITKQSMSVLVDYLKQNDFVEILPDMNDKRAQIVKLTDKGHLFLNSYKSAIKNIDKDIEKQLGNQKLKKLRQYLSKIEFTKTED